MRKIKATLKDTYYQLLIEFLRESGIHGLKIFLTNSSVRYAKLLWLSFLISIIITTHIIIVNLIINYLDQPTEVHMSTRLVHVSNSQFPAVGICSTNKISRKKVLKFAEKVFDAQQTFEPDLLAEDVNEMSKYVLLFKGFLMHPFDNYRDSEPRLHKLHQIMTHMYNNSEYPIRDILFELSPDCEGLIVRAMIFGQTIKNITRFFSKRTTSAGICCMFNYNRESYSNNVARRRERNMFTETAPKITFQSNSILNSVKFVLQNDPEDYAFTEFDSYAFQLYLFPKDEYPVVNTNTVGNVILDHNTLAEIAVQPTFYYASRSTYNFSPAIRKCYFDEEGQRFLNKSFYSLDECLLVCLMQTMQQYCGCVRAPLVGSLINASICNLLQLPCLFEWRRVFNDISYFAYLGDTIPVRSSEFARCSFCMPTCQGVKYEMQINRAPLRELTAGNVYRQGFLKGLSNTKPLSIVQMYYKELFASSTTMDIISDWVELLNLFGGILSLFYGFSIISYVEIIYFLSGKWFLLLYRHWMSWRNKYQRTGVLKSVAETSVAIETSEPKYNLYWQELQPKFAKVLPYAKPLEISKQYRY